MLMATEGIDNKRQIWWDFVKVNMGSFVLTR